MFSKSGRRGRLSPVSGKRSRSIRESELVRATRTLFDERGSMDAPVEEIARTVGIARGLIYRHFSSRDELYVLTITTYLAELSAILVAIDDPDQTARLSRRVHAYAEFCRRYPAFVDCTLSLMHDPAQVLHERVSESVWLRLGTGMASCIECLAEVLRAGSESGEFATEDPDYAANVIWTQILGAMHLARIGVGIRTAAAGGPDLFVVPVDRVVATCVHQALAAANHLSRAQPSAV